MHNIGYDVEDYGNITEEREGEKTQMSQIHGHERMLRNPDEVAIFNGKVQYSRIFSLVSYWLKLKIYRYNYLVMKYLIFRSVNTTAFGNSKTDKGRQTSCLCFGW